MNQSTIRIDLSPAKTCASPRNRISEPMVTMIEGSCSTMTKKALKAPMASPAIRPSPTASGTGTPDAWAQAKMQADNAMLAAGDRSISPAMMTMVRTSATSAISADSAKLRKM